MGKVKETKKTPTEPITISDVWGEVKPKYIEFVKWLHHPDDDFDFVVVEFLEDQPEAYKNKWQRDQFKILVNQEGIERYLSGGNRLFAVIKAFMLNQNDYLTNMGKLQIDRIGSGFQTDYSISKI